MTLLETATQQALMDWIQKRADEGRVRERRTVAELVR